ncbi:MAG: hypothetical protein WC385_02235 [Candidatus Paceibacterota bacterium]
MKEELSDWEKAEQILRDGFDLAGKIVTILTVNEVNKLVVCYSAEIDGGRVLKVLNLNTDYTVRYRAKRYFRLRGAKKIFFPLYKKFRKTGDDDLYVGIIGVTVPPWEDGFPTLDIPE